MIERAIRLFSYTDRDQSVSVSRATSRLEPPKSSFSLGGATATYHLNRENNTALPRAKREHMINAWLRSDRLTERIGYYGIYLDRTGR